MNRAEAEEAILERWDSSWSSLQPAIPFTFDNEEFEGVDQWARVTIRPSSSRQVTMGPVGSRRFERRGNIFVQLFGPIDVGSKPLALLSADVRTALESRSIAGVGGGEPVSTYAANEQDVGTDGRWYIVVLSVAFSYHETR